MPTIQLPHSVAVSQLLLTFDAVREFEKNATGVLGELYESKPVTARELLEQPLESWGQRTVLAVADGGQQMDFMAHECCQTKLNKNWFGKITTYTTIWQASSVCIARDNAVSHHVFH